jgi:GTPase SAR1 family protein
VKFQIWDTAGQEKVSFSFKPLLQFWCPRARHAALLKDLRGNPLAVVTSAFGVRAGSQYRSLAPMYYRGAQVAIIVYDITRAVTFETLQVRVFMVDVDVFAVSPRPFRCGSRS